MNGSIRKYVSRYVIPFYFNNTNNEYSIITEKLVSESIDFKSIGLPKDCNWEMMSFWENHNEKVTEQPEIDIYPYLLDVLNQKEKSITGENLGASFVLKTNGSIFRLQYVAESENEEIGFKCTDLGILFFRNGIGFIWYDIKFDETPSTEVYINFQHDFKELARTHSDNFRKKTGKDTYEVFCMGKWLSQLLDMQSLGIHFWAKRMHNNGNNPKIALPDKALLFQYLFIDNADNVERMNLAFRIANGYDMKYNAPSTLKAETYEPFGNTCFYTSKTGTAYVVSNNESNAAFFEGNFTGKYIRDYFFIWVLLLYQTYSCAHYSRLLTKLPAEIESIENNINYIVFLENLDSQINLFLVKSVFDSVSNIQHQNGMYIFGKKALRIEEDIKNLTVGLEALRGIEVERQRKYDEQKQIQSEQKERQEKEALEKKEKIEKDKIEREEKEKQALEDSKDRALNKGIALFGFLIVISAVIDALNLVDWFEDHTLNFGHWILLGIIAVLTIFMCLVLIFNTHKKNRRDI